MAKNNLTITVILEHSVTEKDVSLIKEKLMLAYKTEDVLILMGLGYHDFIITNKSKGTTYGRFKKHI